MKNNNGFTLIELLSVVALLAIVAVIAGPKVFNIISDSENDQNIHLEKKIINATRIYISKKGYTEGNDYNFVKISELKKEGILDSDLKNSKTKITCSDEEIINFSFDRLKINYNLDNLSCL